MKNSQTKLLKQAKRNTKKLIGCVLKNSFENFTLQCCEFKCYTDEKRFENASNCR